MSVSVRVRRWSMGGGGCVGVGDLGVDRPVGIILL